MKTGAFIWQWTCPLEQENFKLSSERESEKTWEKLSNALEDDYMTQKEADPGGCPVMLRLKKEEKGDLLVTILRDLDS